MTADAGDPLGWVAEELERLDAEGLRRPTRVCRTLPGGRVEIDGRELWNFGSNDYLGLAASPLSPDREEGAVLTGAGDSPPDSVADGCERPLPYGRASALPCGATASPAVVGRSPEVAELERTIAEFEGTEDAVVFPTGYAANLGTVSALTGPGDAVFLERDCHACLVDGARLGGGRLRVWRRGPGWAGGLPKLERELQKAADARRRWIVTDAVFSMDGDAVPLPGLLELARRYDAAIVMDEAHATGVCGRGGRGWWEACGTEVEDAPPTDPRVIRTGTLSKAVGAAGGFVSGSQSLCDYLRHTAKSHIFSTALPPAVAAAGTANLRWIASPAGAAARERLERTGTRLTRALRDAFGVDRLPGTEGCPIVPLLCGDPNAAVRASAALAEAGFFVPAIRPPTVPRGTSRLRVSLSAAHPDEAVDDLANALIHLLKDAA
ncbi:aminotransferase class I/II-fold pyridoxal phosphate-dependent enzyme [Alienimonas sp. DA493]|uniref:aminotransferase class I/II-fold pyridoxal phosphate-dependent enzyme n=1 Tax=Alienimonas sp. DA493 TaxID=3373605 RepID=UPI003754F4F6